jgi:S1-C subfamily serine protease
VQVGRAARPRAPACSPSAAASAARSCAGDVITAVNDEPVADLDDMLAQLERRQPGDTVTLTLWRNGQTRKQAVPCWCNCARPWRRSRPT